MNKDFQKYLSYYNIGWKIATTYFSIMFLCFIIGLCVGNNINFLGFFIFGALILLTLLPLIFTKKYIKKLVESGDFEAIKSDFEKAVSMRKDRVRFGENYVFLKGKCKILKYSEIKQVYQHILKRNFVESERHLKYVNAEGKTKTLCTLMLRGKSDEELKQMLTIIHSKNPDVKIGYR